MKSQKAGGLPVGWAYWHTPLSPALGRQRVGEFKTSLAKGRKSCIEPKTTVIISQPCVEEEGVIHSENGVLLPDNKTFNRMIGKSVLRVVRRERNTMP